MKKGRKALPPPEMEMENDFPNMPDLDDDEAYYTMLKGMNVDSSTWFGKNAKARAKYEAWLKANPEVLLPLESPVQDGARSDIPDIRGRDADEAYFIMLYSEGHAPDHGVNTETKSKSSIQPKAILQGAVDINTATTNTLMTLHGVREARAKAIIKGRPYARKDELVHKGIIPQSVYDEIKEQIIAKQK